MAKTRTKLDKIIPETLIFLFLVIFPFGQLVRIPVQFFSETIVIHPIDVVAGLSLIYFLIAKLAQPKISKYIYAFLAAAVFSLLFSLTLFESSEILKGSLYLLRLFSYVGFFMVVRNYAKSKDRKSTLLLSLIAVSVFTAIYSWIQLFWLPDLRDLKFLGWDDHKYRLTGGFLDPGFTGIILVLGFLASLTHYLKSKKYTSLIASVFLVLSVVFTYSRASYLALFAGLLTTILLVKRGVKVVFITVVLIFLITIPILPRSLSEGAQLERTHSIFAKVSDYKQTVLVIKESPVFGVGYNNLCLAKVKVFNIDNTVSHSCSGSDSSLLFVFATTGIVGLIIFAYAGWSSIKGVKRDVYGIAFTASVAALFVHSLFLNSLFYSWVMGWIAVLLAIALPKRSRSS